MDRMVIAGGYGICLFSADTLQDFLKREKIRKRKLLSLLQKDKELYLNTQREGIFIPLVGIDHYNYAIKLEGQDEPFDDQYISHKNPAECIASLYSSHLYPIPQTVFIGV